MIPGPDIYPNTSFEVYQSWEAVNHHTLWRLKQESPYHARREQESGGGETEALAFGTLTHFILLEPGRFAADAVVQPAIPEEAPRRPTKRQRTAKEPSADSRAAIKFWEEWDAAHAGKIIVTAEDYAAVMEIGAAVRQVQCRQYICSGRSEVSIVWRDEKTGLLCKARLDYERDTGFDHYIIDLKSARSAHPMYWQWAIDEYGYFQQLAWYHDGWLALTGDTSLCFWLIAEKKWPVVKVRQCDDQTLQAGRNSYREALDRYAECVKMNIWPAYGAGVELIGLKRWSLEREGVGPHLIQPEPQQPEAPSPAADPEVSFEEAYDL